MSFPPPPPPPRPPSQQYPPPPPGGPRPTNNGMSLANGMSNLHVSTPGNVPQQQGHHQQYGFQAPPPQPPSVPRGFPPQPNTPQPPSHMQPPPPPNMPIQQQPHRPPPPPSPYQGSGVGVAGYSTQQAQAIPQQSSMMTRQPLPPATPPPPAQGYRTPNNMPHRPPPPPSPYGNMSQGYPGQGYPPPPAPPRPPAPMGPPAGYQQQGHVATPRPPPHAYPPGPPPPQVGQPGPPPPPGPPRPVGRPGPPPPGHGPSYPQRQQQYQQPQQQYQQQQPAQQQQQQQPKIDPAQIPRPPLFTRPNDNGPLPIFSPKAAAAQTRIGPPPPADSRYLVQDDGNASPEMIRSNLYSIPSDGSTRQKLGDVEMGLLCSPLKIASQDYAPTFGPQPENENGESARGAAPLDPQRIPIIQGVPRGSKGTFVPPPRCRSCLAYVNPYWGMDTNTCNFCGTRNATHKDFDVMSLQRGTVDYAVDGPYITRPLPVQPVFLYALDLTSSNVQEYVAMLEEVGIELGRHFQQQPAQQALRERQQQQGGNVHDHLDPNALKLRQQRPRIGICFVASFGVVVLKRNGPQGMPISMIMPDITGEPYCHVPLTEWTFDLSTPEGVDQWTQHIQEDLLDGELLKQLRKEAAKKNAYGLDGFELSCGGAGMAFCADALAETGGRATWVSSRRPNFGAGYIRHRGSSTQSRKPQSVEDATPVQNLKNPRNKEDEGAGAFYRKLQETCSKGRIVLDIIIHSNPQHAAHQQLELATQGEICRATCGKLTWIAAPGLGWKEPFAQELKRPLMCFQGWDAVFKVRCSSGLQVKSFTSPPGTLVDGGGLAASPELELSCVTPQTNLAVVLEHKIGGLPKKQPFAFVQSALLYSTLSGERRVRVSTLALRASVSVPDIFLSFDFNTYATLFLRRAVSLLQGGTNDGKEDLNALHRQTRDSILQQIVNLLVSYRQHTNAVNSPRGQLILPEKLQLLPLFTMCLLKSPMLRPSLGRRAGPAVVISPTNDERAYYAFQAMMVGPAAAFLLVHPNVFEVGKLAEGVGELRIPKGIESAISELSKASYQSCVQLPQTVNASMTCLLDDGIYLVDNGLAIYLFFGKDVPQERKKELYHLPISISGGGEAVTDYGSRVRRIVWQLRSFCSVGTDGSRSEMRPTYPPVIPVWQGNQSHLLFEQYLMNCMVDDPNSGEKDYTDYLVKLHRLIREKLEPSGKK